MQILVNENNVITSYATVGGFDGGIEVDDSIIPANFTTMFRRNMYLYLDGEIVYNENFVDTRNTVDLENNNQLLTEKVAQLEEEIEQLKSNITPSE